MGKVKDSNDQGLAKIEPNSRPRNGKQPKLQYT